MLRINKIGRRYYGIKIALDNDPDRLDLADLVEEDPVILCKDLEIAIEYIRSIGGGTLEIAERDE